MEILREEVYWWENMCLYMYYNFVRVNIGKVMLSCWIWNLYIRFVNVMEFRKMFLGYGILDFYYNFVLSW